MSNMNNLMNCYKRGYKNAIAVNDLTPFNTDGNGGLYMKHRFTPEIQLSWLEIILPSGKLICLEDYSLISLKSKAEGRSNYIFFNFVDDNVLRQENLTEKEYCGVIKNPISDEVDLDFSGPFVNLSEALAELIEWYADEYGMEPSDIELLDFKTNDSCKSSIKFAS